MWGIKGDVNRENQNTGLGLGWRSPARKLLAPETSIDL